jgi:adenosylcobyric acid synthase
LVLGLCGGYQLLGRTVADPVGVESTVTEADGLGLLEVDTHFEQRKTLNRVEATVAEPHQLGHGCPIVGYEVHQGVTRRRAGVPAWLRLHRQPGGEGLDGAARPDGLVYGTYVHGLFDDARFCRAVVAELRRRRGLAPLPAEAWRRPPSCDRGGWLAGACDLRPVAAALGI